MVSESVLVKELNGVYPGTATTLSIVGRYCTMDSATPGTSNPCKVPTSNYYYSAWKSMFLDVSGTFNSIRDIYWYGDGSTTDSWGLDHANGGQLSIGVLDNASSGNGCAYASYAPATFVQWGVGTSGDSIGHATNGHPLYRAQSTPFANSDDYTAATPLLIDATVYTSSVPFKSKLWVTQLRIPTTATHGELTSRTFYLSYQVY